MSTSPVAVSGSSAQSAAVSSGLTAEISERVSAVSENGQFKYEVVTLNNGRYAFISPGELPIEEDDAVELFNAVDEANFIEGLHIPNITLAALFVPVFEHFTRQAAAA